MSAPSSPSGVARIGYAPLELEVAATLRWGKASSLSRLEHLLLGVELGSGALGIAELAIRPTIYGETMEGAVHALRRHFAPALLGLDARDDAAIATALDALPFNFGLRGALSMAIADATRRRTGSDLVRAELGPLRRPRVSTILGIANLTEMIQQAKVAVQAGVRVLKVKVGRDPRADAQVLSALRAEFGSDVTVYVDANEAFDEAGAPRALDHLARLGVAYVEEPLPVHRLRARARLRALELLPIVADDSCFRLTDVERELEADTFDVLNVKPARSGWNESIAMLQRAREAGKGVMVGSQASSGLGTLHAAVVASQAGVTHPSELSFPLNLRRDSLDRPPPIADGRLDVEAYAAARLASGSWRPTWLP